MSWVFLAVAGALYFAPCLVAYSRGHKNLGAITTLNILLGWTVLGWIVAAIWAHTGNTADPAAPSPASHVKCPDCAELIKKEARVCKHCGCRLVPQALA